MYQTFESRRCSRLGSVALSPEALRAAVFTVGLVVPFATYALISHEMLVVGVVAALGLGCLSVSRPPAAVILLTASMPLILRAPHGGQAAALAIAIPVAAVTAQAATGAMPVRARHLPAFILMGLVLLSYAFPAVRLFTPVSRLADLTGLLAGLAFLVVATVASPSPYRLAQTICCTGAVMSAILLVSGHYADHRLEGFGMNPNYVGVLGALPFVGAVGLACHRRAPVWLMVAVPCGGVLVATKSRGSMLAAAVGIVVILMTGRSVQSRILVTAAALTTALAIPGCLNAVESVGAGSRSATELSFNNAIREQAAGVAVKVALAHPFRGIGYDMFPPYAAHSPGLGIYMNTHDDFLRLASEAGLPSVAVLIAILWMACRWNGQGDLRVLRAVVVSYTVCLLFANTLSSLELTMPFWAALGCLLAHTPDRARCFPDPRGSTVVGALSDARNTHSETKSRIASGQ